jgi:CO/xanthine dehydrogenase Mo-binding subunit
MRDGRMANAQLTNYIIPTTLDTPPLDVVMLENPYTHGPFGAKGVGEMPIDGPAPAVINALRHAGFDLRAIPATPERLMTAARVVPGRSKRGVPGRAAALGRRQGGAASVVP